MMNFALLQAAAAAQAKQHAHAQGPGGLHLPAAHHSGPGDHHYHGNGFPHGPRASGLAGPDDMSTAYRKNALLEAENEALRQKVQRDNAEKLNLVHMLFTQMQQNGQIPGPHNPAGRGTSSSDEDNKPSRPPQSRYWTEEEHQRFLDAVKIYGAHDHKAIATKVGTRTSSQVRSHSQKFFKKLEAHKGAGLPSMNRKKKHEQNHAGLNIIQEHHHSGSAVGGSSTGNNHNHNNGGSGSNGATSTQRSNSHDVDVEG
jgi:SHAQKYF class myb-like DNA-binding protein